MNTESAAADPLHIGLVAQPEILARAQQASGQKALPHPTVDERRAVGRAARTKTPRHSLGAWQSPQDRADPVALLMSQETTRVAHLIPVRHARMATSAFAFYRGAALVMAADLATRPRSGLHVQLCGDAHLSNFGVFAAPDRSLVFDVNDFDETHPGPFEWDVQRLATSFILAARENGMSNKAGAAAAEVVCSSYRQSIAKFAERRELDVWYHRIDVNALLGASKDASDATRKAKKLTKEQQQVAHAESKARLRDAWSAVSKITEVVDGKRQFRHDPPLLLRIDVTDDLRAVINSLFHEYRATLQEDRQALLKRYEVVDFGHKVVGVGSVGLLAFVLLLRGRDEDDLMVLQVKQAQASVLEAFTQKSAFTKQGHRVVTGQRLMQAASDSFLGWIDGPAGRNYYVRQLRDMKWAPDPSSLTGKRLSRYASRCGMTLARAHARSGDAIALSAYLGSGTAFDKATSAFALSYADQAEQDFDAFVAAIADDRLSSHEDAGGAESMRAAQAVVES
ncbi:DUF2252 domain-containing protein [Demequina oxidasica]|uniref:DUF2252 domain-containing protein n=1 Tax=Demequina oxidasica TaxID=676199 RepID=UPI000A064224|nr:DUF2252 domain-containing protein [Demequina oxidasica]